MEARATLWARLLPLHPASLAAFLTVLVGYTLSSWALQHFYYLRRAGDAHAWKSQPRCTYGGAASAAAPWVPLLLSRAATPEAGRSPLHASFATANLVTASCFAAATAELGMRGLSRMRGGGLGLGAFVCELLAACAMESVVEYLWHRMMHLDFCYRRLHKHHHFYKAPRPFDDMFIHPLEAVGYYCILYSPPFVVPMHGASFLAYMVLMGACGVLDHSGVRISVPWIYDSRDHDLHHELFNFNFGFPFAALDVLCGTYRRPAAEALVVGAGTEAAFTALPRADLAAASTALRRRPKPRGSSPRRGLN